MDGEPKEEDAMERKGNHAHRGTPEILCEILRYEIFRI